jgi:thymidylate synthase
VTSHIFAYPTASEALPAICADLLENGMENGSRNGRVKEFLNSRIVLLDPQQRYVLSDGRKCDVFAQIAETMWVLAGRNDIEWLSAYLPRAKDYSDDGQTWRAGYGRRIRHWDCNPGDPGLDQLAYVVDTLREDPLSRQAVIGIWEPVTDTLAGKDKACNTQLQFQSRHGALHLTVTVRSNDLMWGWSGINAFEWSTMQEIVAHLLGITVGTLTFNIGSLHLYEQHWNKASKIEYDNLSFPITPFQMPGERSVAALDSLLDQWFVWEDTCRHGHATMEHLLEIEEPLFREWACAIAARWQPDGPWFEMLEGSGLGAAVARSPRAKASEAPQTSRSTGPGAGTGAPPLEAVRAFYYFVRDLHAAKHKSYGDSWKKRGEKMSILANIARKVDRLGVGDEFDSSADTVIDLLVYLAKYSYWIHGLDAGPENVALRLSYILAETEDVSTEGQALDITFADIVHDMNEYMDNVDSYSEQNKHEFLDRMMRTVAPVARDLWLAENPRFDTDEYRGADAD